LQAITNDCSEFEGKKYHRILVIYHEELYDYKTLTQFKVKGKFKENCFLEPKLRFWFWTIRNWGVQKWRIFFNDIKNLFVFLSLNLLPIIIHEKNPESVRYSLQQVDEDKRKSILQKQKSKYWSRNNIWKNSTDISELSIILASKWWLTSRIGMGGKTFPKSIIEITKKSTLWNRKKVLRIGKIQVVVFTLKTQHHTNGLSITLSRITMTKKKYPK
jgi:hypothetical protein